MWAEHGPAATLIAPVSHLAFVTIALRQDYRTAHVAMRRILAVGQARGYEPDTSQSRFLYAVGTGHWFEPIEENVALARQAREGLLQAGDLQKASHTYFVTASAALRQCALAGRASSPSSTPALAFAKRTGNDEAAVAFRAYQRLVAIAAAAGNSLTSTEDAGSGGAGRQQHEHGRPRLHRPSGGGRPALRPDRTRPALDGADVHAARDSGALPDGNGTPGAGAGSRRQRRAARPPAERSAAVAELDSVIDWLAARATDAPGNFLHLLRLVEAERACATGDFRTAATVLRRGSQAGGGGCGAHGTEALINERAARFYLAHGMGRAGAELLAAARRAYLRLGRDGEGEPARLGLPDARGLTRHRNRTRTGSPRPWRPAVDPTS